MSPSADSSLFELNSTNLLRVVMMVTFFGVMKWLHHRQLTVNRAASLQLRAAKKRNHRNKKRQEMNDEIRNKFTTPDHKRQVVLLYCLRAMVIGSITNAVGEEFYTEALAQAGRVDDLITARKEGRDSSKPKLLEGIPVSIKDAFDQKGADTTCGFAVRCFKTIEEDGLIVRLLRQAGAIPYVRTNIPQALMVPESMNIIWGESKNPWDLSRTPGGSSGGEAALIAARGSVLGLGSDIGGSLRIPAHMCGIYAIKPTPARLTLQGLGIPSFDNAYGQLAIRPVAGPMAHSTDDLVLMMRAFLTDEMWTNDPFVPKLPFDDKVLSGESTNGRKLRIGYYETDGWFEPAPACQRAVRQAVAALEELGHTCVRWTPPAIETAVKIYYGIMSADSAQGVLSGLEGEDINPNYKNLLMMLKTPRVIKKLLSVLLRTSAVNEPRAALMLNCIHPKNSEELYDYQASMLQYITNFTSSWQNEEFDVVLSPGLGTPALLHGGSKDLTVACSYTFLWNVLHYPVGTVPIGVTDKSEVKYESSIQDTFSSKAAETVSGSEGMPIGVQIAALPFQDELVLRVMKELEQKIQFKEQPKLASDIQID